MTPAPLRAELTKICTLRGPLAALALIPLVSVGIGVLGGWSARNAIESRSPMLRADFTAAQAGLDGVQYGQLAAIVFGVLVVTAEYGGGMIGASLLAVPRRGRLYAAKLGAAGLAVLVAAVPATVLSVAGTQLALGPHGASLLAPGVPRAMAGAVLYLTLMALLAAGAAVLARNALVPLAVLLPLVLAGSQILSVIGATREAARYLPDRAGAQLLAVHPKPEDLAPGVGLAVLLAWAAVLLAAAHLAFRRRDA
ncbi:ABC transporter permease [Spirillospora sp. CA-253888]